MVRRGEVLHYGKPGMAPVEMAGIGRAAMARPHAPEDRLARHAFCAAIHALGLACRTDGGKGLSFLIPTPLSHAILGLEGFEISTSWPEASARMVMIDYWEDGPTQASILSAIGRLGRCLDEAGWHVDTVTALDLVAATFRQD